MNHHKKVLYLYIFCLLPSSLRSTTIAFLVQHLSFRGTEIALYDYAHCNETILGNTSIIINRDIKNKNEVKKRFQERFGDRFYDCASWEEMDNVLRIENVDILYIIKPAFLKPRTPDNKLTNVCKTAVHIVFGVKPPIHADKFAHVSQWLAKQYPQYSPYFVPHMVHLPEVSGDMRDELNIPESATVFGRYGGWDSFNLSFVHGVVEQVARERSDIYFLFLNTQKFCSLPNSIYLPKTTDLEAKTKFINTCDAMLHARRRGETFGLSCAEFAIRNKPIISWFNSYERTHIELLGNKGIFYTTPKTLYEILLNFKKEPDKQWDIYSERFNPEAVMKQFDEVFIQSL